MDRRRRAARTVALMSLFTTTDTRTDVPIASFDGDGSDLVSLSVAIEPVQDLNGYDNPWPAGGGKNLFDASTFATTSKNGVTCTNNGDGSFTLNGTATADIFFAVFSYQFGTSYGGTPLPTGSYRLTGCPPNGSASTYYMYITPSYTPDTGSGGTNANTTVTGGSIFIKSGYTCDNLVFWPMLRLASNGDDTFAPYSNICPISGHSSVNVIVSPTLNPLDGTTYSITFPSSAGTVYGGTLDVTTGKLTVDRANIASYNGETLTGRWISDRDVYSAGTTPTIGAQVVYELTTPIVYNLTPTQVTTLIGTNNIWADTGDIKYIEYNI